MVSRKKSEATASRQHAVVTILITSMMQGMSVQAAARVANCDYSTARELMANPEHSNAFREVVARMRREFVDETLDRMALLNRRVMDRLEEALDDDKLKPSDLIKIAKALWDRSGLPAESVVRHGSADLQQMTMLDLVRELPGALAVLDVDAADVDAIDVPVLPPERPPEHPPAADTAEPHSPPAAPPKARRKRVSSRARGQQEGVTGGPPGEKDPPLPGTAKSPISVEKTDVSEEKPRARRRRARRKPR